MTKEQADFIQDAMDYCEIPCKTREYSGRCMYGRQTWAVVASHPLEVLGAVVEYLKRGFGYSDPSEIPSFDDLRQDSMGRDDVVIY